MGAGFAVPSLVQGAVESENQGFFLSCLVMMKLRYEELWPEP